jgi:hypothetical protein
MGKKVQKVKEVKTRTLPARINKVRDLIESAGNTIGSVEFKKRSSSEIRKMAYRLHVVPERVEKQNKSLSDKSEYSYAASRELSKKIQKKREKDLKNLQVTVYDTNVRAAGKSSYRTIPLENVTRIRVKGVTYEIV